MTTDSKFPNFLTKLSAGIVLVSHDLRLISRVCQDKGKSEIWVVENRTVMRFPRKFEE